MCLGAVSKRSSIEEIGVVDGEFHEDEVGPRGGNGLCLCLSPRGVCARPGDYRELHGPFQASAQVRSEALRPIVECRETGAEDREAQRLGRRYNRRFETAIMGQGRF